MDEWVMERYELDERKNRSDTGRENGRRTVLRFFYKGSNVLQQVIHVMDHGIAGKILKNFRNRIMNYIRIFCPKIMKILMEILHMHRKCWENTESIYLSLYRASWHDCLCV